MEIAVGVVHPQLADYCDGFTSTPVDNRVDKSLMNGESVQRG